MEPVIVTCWSPARWDPGKPQRLWTARAVRRPPVCVGICAAVAAAAPAAPALWLWTVGCGLQCHMVKAALRAISRRFLLWHVCMYKNSQK